MRLPASPKACTASNKQILVSDLFHDHHHPDPFQVYHRRALEPWTYRLFVHVHDLHAEYLWPICRSPSAAQFFILIIQ